MNAIARVWAKVDTAIVQLSLNMGPFYNLEPMRGEDDVVVTTAKTNALDCRVGEPRQSHGLCRGLVTRVKDEHPACINDG